MFDVILKDKAKDWKQPAKLRLIKKEGTLCEAGAFYTVEDIF